MEVKKKKMKGRRKGNPAHRETVEARVVVRRVDVSTIEIKVVHIRSIRISSS